MEAWRIDRRPDVSLLTNGKRSYALRMDGRIGLAEITRTIESTWILTHDGRTYEVEGGSVVCSTPGRKELWRKALPLASIMEAWKKVPSTWIGHDGQPTYPTHMDREPWHVTLDRVRGELLAATRNMPAAVVALTLEGDARWSAFVGSACCNFACIAGPESILHASSCGRSVTVLSPEGAVVKRVDLDYVPVLFLRDEPDGAVAAGYDRVVALSGAGEVRWRYP